MVRLAIGRPDCKASISGKPGESSSSGGGVAALERQLELLGEPCAPDEFLSMLETEHRVKPEVRERRSVGFVH